MIKVTSILPYGSRPNYIFAGYEGSVESRDGNQLVAELSMAGRLISMLPPVTNPIADSDTAKQICAQSNISIIGDPENAAQSHSNINAEFVSQLLG